MPLKVKTCIEESCKRFGQPYYGYPGRKWETCQYHKKHGMVRLDKQCEISTCPKPPAYGHVNGAVIFCADHRAKGMIFRAGCYAAGCLLPKVYGYIDGAPQTCIKHKRQDMVRLLHTCEHDGCRAKPTHGFEGDEARFCTHHQLDRMVPRIFPDPNKRCCQEGCDNHPRFGFPDGKPDFCEFHKLEGMVDLIPAAKKLCQQPGCIKSPTFFFKGGPKRFCVDHKLPGMERHKGPQCKEEGCEATATFAFKGQKPKQYCAKHKKQGMAPMNVCRYPTCNKWPMYGNVFGAPLVCAEHKVEGMVKKGRICKFPSCQKEPYYGFEEGPKVFCTHHKEPGMVLKKNEKSRKWRKLCKIDGCKKSPHYRYPPVTGPRDYCADHVPGGTPADRNRCIVNNCSRKKVWGMPGEPPRYCLDHRISGMVRNDKICETPECPEKAVYGFSDEKARFCESHQLPEMVMRVKIKGTRKRVANVPCNVEDCAKIAVYGRGDNLQQVCEVHREKDMVSSKPMCSEEDCNNLAIYAQPDPNAKVEKCAIHRKADMVLRVKKLGRRPQCEIPECEGHALYGEVGTRARFCEHHKTDNLVAFKRQIKRRKKKRKKKVMRRCEEVSCKEIAIFGFKAMKPRYCETHKMDGMMQIARMKWCEQLSCLRSASFGFKGKPPKFCEEHLKTGMVSTPKLVLGFIKEEEPEDSTNNKTSRNSPFDKLCEGPNCPESARYGFANQRVRFCEGHRTSGMIPIKKIAKKPLIICQHADCKNVAAYGFKNGTRQVCVVHKLAGMVNKMAEAPSPNQIPPAPPPQPKHVCEKKMCREAARYGFASGPRRFCEKHKWPGMKLKSAVI